MAKTQRWRRGRPAGEDTASTQDASTEAPATGQDEAGPEDGSVPDVTPDDVPLDTDPDGDPDLEPELAADLRDLEEPDEDDDLDDLDDDTSERPALGSFDEPPSGPAGFLFGGKSPAEVVPLQLLQAAHAKQAIGTSLAMGLVAAVAGRPAREAGVVLLTVLVGQTILGWHNDIVDRRRDQSHALKGKPLAMGRLQPETVWYAIVVATLLLVPLAITTGIRAGCLYLAAVAVGMLGNVVLRTGFFSWWSWAASYALLPAYLSYGGWGGQAVGSAPETSIVVLSALLGIGIHFLRAVWGLVADNEDGWTYLPLKLGLKLGATRLLALATVYTVVIVILLLVTGARVGLSR
ncbi:MAG: hypothetical protein NTX33_06460 [Propionibacteriales bacterium]|nr:hypothetical protein [Propionibacteriales bacterium]